jgi:hypothetical protein
VLKVVVRGVVDPALYWNRIICFVGLAVCQQQPDLLLITNPLMPWKLPTLMKHVAERAIV